MKIYKVREVKTPTRGTSKSAGIDFYVPEDFAHRVLHPQEDVLIPAGIKVEVPEGYMLMAADKSGIATKKKLGILAKIVDEDYTGEVHIHLMNHGKSLIDINPNDKIAQFILVPVLYDSIDVVDDITEMWKNTSTERGDGGFGSTDKK